MNGDFTGTWSLTIQPQPCPSCGTCPTCGARPAPYWANPYRPWWGQAPNPTWYYQPTVTSTNTDGTVVYGDSP